MAVEPSTEVSEGRAGDVATAVRNSRTTLSLGMGSISFRDPTLQRDNEIVTTV